MLCLNFVRTIQCFTRVNISVESIFTNQRLHLDYYFLVFHCCCYYFTHTAQQLRTYVSARGYTLCTFRIGILSNFVFKLIQTDTQVIYLLATISVFHENKNCVHNHFSLIFRSLTSKQATRFYFSH